MSDRNWVMKIIKPNMALPFSQKRKKEKKRLGRLTTWLKKQKRNYKKKKLTTFERKEKKEKRKN